MRIEQEVLYDNHCHKNVKRQALAILLFAESIDIKTVSRVVGVSERQIRNYRRTYEEQGSTVVANDNRYKPVSELKAYEPIIKGSLLSTPVATASEACQRIETLTGLKRSPTQVRKFMKDMGLKPLKVASIPAKANPVEQEKFLETVLEPRIKEAQEGKRTLLFLDAAHFVWQLYLGVLWCMSRIFIPGASGRTRINVLGAYDPIKNELIKIINRAYINSETVMELLKKVRAVYQDSVITIVLDNAKYQLCKAVKEKAEELGIELLFLPTYSPNLNLIERLWRFVKKECLYSKHYKTANEFEQAIVSCLEKINTTKKDKMKSLMTLKFQMFNDSSKSKGDVPPAVAA